MPFDRARNAAELREFTELCICCVIGSVIATGLGVSGILGATVTVIAFKYWQQRKGITLSPQLRILGALVCFALLLSQNWSAYCEGFANGYNAAIQGYETAALIGSQQP
jgi:hypothetical protein